NNPAFRPAAAHLAAQEDFKDDPAGYQEMILGVRQQPETIDAVAKAMVEDENPSDKAALEQYVRGELQTEALTRQYVLLIDKSGSMTIPDPDGGRYGNRWGAAELATQKIIHTAFKFDMDNKVPTYLFGHKVDEIGEISDPQHVMSLFSEYRPDGCSTNLAAALDMAMATHLGAARNNYGVVPGTTFIILTDGRPNSESAVEAVVQKYANPANGYVKDDQELALLFIQLGDDKGASDFLQKINHGWTFPTGKCDVAHCLKDNDLASIGPEAAFRKAIFE
ncbi:MAG: hypothetical protein OXT67_06915, partial [Zetaproteobacteria bacterium]|nr:hypothetical protein [Zetaproteobacteria bacterium]